MKTGRRGRRENKSNEVEIPYQGLVRIKGGRWRVGKRRKEEGRRGRGEGKGRGRRGGEGMHLPRFWKREKSLKQTQGDENEGEGRGNVGEGVA